MFLKTLKNKLIISRLPKLSLTPDISFKYFKRAYHLNCEEKFVEMIRTGKIVPSDPDIKMMKLNQNDFERMLVYKDELLDHYEVFKKTIKNELKDNPDITEDMLRKRTI